MRNIFLLSLIALFSVNAMSAEYTVLGLDNDGVETQGTIQDSEYKKLIHYELDQSEQLLDQQVVMNPNFRNKLQLKTVMLGFGLDSSLKLGPFTIGAAVSHQFYYDIVRQ